MTQAAMRMLAMSKAIAFPAPQGSVYPIRKIAAWIAAVRSEATLGGFVAGWGNPDGTYANGVPQWQKAQGSHYLRKCFQLAGDESLGAECSHDDHSEGASLWRALITRTLPRARLAQHLRQCQAIISEPDGCLHDSTWAWRTAVMSACRSVELFANDDSHGIVK